MRGRTAKFKNKLLRVDKVETEVRYFAIVKKVFSYQHRIFIFSLKNVGCKSYPLNEIKMFN